MGGGKMERYTLKQLKSLVDSGGAIDISHFTDDEIFMLKRKHTIKQIGFCIGQYGCNGMLLLNIEEGKLYCVVGRVSALWLF